MPEIVLILGAGASAPYGFPVGRSYKAKILGLLRHGEGDPTWPQLDVDPKKRAELADDFERAPEKSIDLFLRKRYVSSNLPEAAIYQRIGKLAIARAILNSEFEQKTTWSFNTGKDDDWYTEFWGIVDPILEAVNRLDVAFVTFNYDRSLEYFLYDALKRTSPLGTDEETIIRGWRAFRIFHIYGSLGHPDFINIDNGLGYGLEVTAERIDFASNKISLLGERSSIKDQVRIRTWFKEASRISFLGFGFAADNLAQLGFQDSIKGKTLFASGLNLAAKTRDNAVSYLSSLNASIRFGQPHETIVQCLNSTMINIL